MLFFINNISRSKYKTRNILLDIVTTNFFHTKCSTGLHGLHNYVYIIYGNNGQFSLSFAKTLEKIGVLYYYV